MTSAPLTSKLRLLQSQMSRGGTTQSALMQKSAKSAPKLGLALKQYCVWREPLLETTRQVHYISLWVGGPDVTASHHIKNLCRDVAVGSSEASTKEHSAEAEDGYMSIVSPPLSALISYATRGPVWDPLRAPREQVRQCETGNQPVCGARLNWMLMRPTSMDSSCTL